MLPPTLSLALKVSILAIIIAFTRSSRQPPGMPATPRAARHQMDRGAYPFWGVSEGQAVRRVGSFAANNCPPYPGVSDRSALHFFRSAVKLVTDDRMS